LLAVGPQIVADLRDPSTVPAEGIAATAEMYTAEICEVTGGQPASVCGAPIVHQYQALLDGATAQVATPSKHANTRSLTKQQCHFSDVSH
jgi:hypothetical protein